MWEKENAFQFSNFFQVWTVFSTHFPQLLLLNQTRAKKFKNWQSWPWKKHRENIHEIQTLDLLKINKGTKINNNKKKPQEISIFSKKELFKLKKEKIYQIWAAEHFSEKNNQVTKS